MAHRPKVIRPPKPYGNHAPSVGEPLHTCTTPVSISIDIDDASLKRLDRFIKLFGQAKAEHPRDTTPCGLTRSAAIALLSKAALDDALSDDPRLVKLSERSTMAQ